MKKARTVMALFADHLGQLAVAYTRVSSVISGPLLGIFLLGTLCRRATSLGVLSGAAIGGGAVLLIIRFTKWSFFYYGPIALAVTMFTGYLVSLASPSPPESKIRGLVLGVAAPLDHETLSC